VRVDDLARDVADVLVADAGVVLALGRREALAREAERHALAEEEVLLLEAEPGVGIVRDGGAAVGRMRRPVREEHLAHDEHTVDARGVGEDGDRLEHAVRVATLGLARRAAVEAPHGELLEAREARELLDLGLAAQVRDGLVAIEPDVFELVFRHEALPVLTVAPRPLSGASDRPTAAGVVN
jgi:hypothetical protein